MASHTIPREDTRFFGHPRGLATLFFTEMWERFSYYGMRALLILFMTASVANGGLGFSVAKSALIYGLYTAMVYLVSLPGGWIADRLIGQQRAVLYGGILIAAGEFCLVAPSVLVFYLGLIVLVIGTGFLKPNVSTIVGQLYSPGDPRRDAGFSIFYMGINIGALSPLLVSTVGEKINFRWGFGLAGIGMVAGVLQYILQNKHLGQAGRYPTPAESPEKARSQKRLVAAVVLGGLALFAAVGIAAASGAVELTAERVSDAVGVLLVILSAGVFVWLIFGRGWTPVERKRSAAILVLFLASAMFWSAFEQAGSSLNLFAERSTDRHIGSFEFPAGWFQWVQPAFVIVLAPAFAWLWIRLGRREPPSPAKFTLGLLFVALGFVVLLPVAGGVKVSPLWLVLTYFLHTVGEMCLSPVGLSAITKLAAARIAGLTMGVWFLSIAVGNYMAGRMASLYESMPVPTLFAMVAAFAVATAIVLAILIKPTVRLMGGVK
jgi:POT family proton-dependent oligopeptide transporter